MTNSGENLRRLAGSQSPECPVAFATMFPVRWHETVSTGSVVTPSRKTLSRRPFSAVCLTLAGFAVPLLAGCARHLEFPPMGAPLPYTVRLELSPSITPHTFQYTDSCGQPEEIPIGRQIEAALHEGARRTFKTVVSDDDAGKATTPDHVINIDIRDWFFTLDKDALYDRVPATLQMNAFARMYDKTGALSRETEFKVVRQERLRLERVGKNCDYIIDPFIENTAVELAYKLFMDARVAFGGPSISTPVAEAPIPDLSGSPPTVAPPPTTTVASPSTLRFKALLLDENSNLIFEGGEHVRVRVDVVNTGTSPVEHASASLTGTPPVIEQFPTTSLRIPTLPPGQTKTVEFIATLPVTIQPLQAEIHVRIAEPNGTAAPSQTLLFRIEPASGRR